MATLAHPSPVTLVHPCTTPPRHWVPPPFIRPAGMREVQKTHADKDVGTRATQEQLPRSSFLPEHIQLFGIHGHSCASCARGTSTSLYNATAALGTPCSSDPQGCGKCRKRMPTRMSVLEQRRSSCRGAVFCLNIASSLASMATLAHPAPVTLVHPCTTPPRHWVPPPFIRPAGMREVQKTQEQFSA